MVTTNKDTRDRREDRRAAAMGEDGFRFELSGGVLCLDFANTLSYRGRADPVERLTSYAALVVWGQQAGVLTDREAQRLARAAARRPAEATIVHAHALTLREALYRLFSAVAAGRSPDTADVTTVNRMLAQALGWLQIGATPEGFRWKWNGPGDALDRMLWPVLRSAADLLTSAPLRNIRECAAPDCGWLFLDTTRNRRRRWCDMQGCGNRAKVRRHRERQKLGGGSPSPRLKPAR
jgi:predicted RNA-binding Zn ribbon-like protein